ncbi:MAG: metal-dependent hydrolase [Pseudomonadota bacterium]
MTELVVRRLLVDLDTPIEARWNGGDAFRSAWFNALSMSFPIGEQYFIDSLRCGLQHVPEPQRAALAGEVQGFIGQEATHRRVHALFNGHLERLGFDNEIERRARRRLQANAFRHASVHVAATAATEHFTSIFANWMLRHPHALEGTEARIKTMWYWHCAEESEHRSTAFTIYQAMGGNHEMRIKVFHYISFVFLTDVLRQTVRNLWHDGSLFSWRTWRSALPFLLGRDGMLRGNLQAWRDYHGPAFHPGLHDASLAHRWLAENGSQFTPVGQAS